MVWGDEVHLFELSSGNGYCRVPSAFGSVILHGLKGYNVELASEHITSKNRVLLKTKDDIVEFDIESRSIVGVSAPVREDKFTNLYKELQRSRGGVNALMPTRQYTVTVPPSRHSYFIETFGLPDDWAEETIIINTTELSVGKGISVSFEFGKDLRRDFIVARNAWDQAFVKKDSKHKFVMSNQVLQALKKNKMVKR